MQRFQHEVHAVVDCICDDQTLYEAGNRGDSR